MVSTRNTRNSVGKMHIALTISMTVATAIFSGCTVKNVHSSKSIATVESLADAQRLVSKGMTMAQVKARLGEPIERSTYNQQTRWGYAEVQTNLSGKKLIMAGFGARYLPDQKSVIVIFNANGRVSKVEFNHQKYS